MIRRLRASCFALPAACVLLALPAVAGATPSSDGVGAVNELRATMGVDAIVNDEELAGDCAAHVAWMATNATFSHSEPVGSAGYSAAGHDAAQNSVLYSSTGLVPQTSGRSVHWRRGAPLHLWQVLHPGLVRSGYAHDARRACMAVSDFDRRPAIDVFDPLRGRDRVFTYPAAGASTEVWEDTSREQPSPNEQVGLPRAQVTGPYLLVFASGFGATGSCGAVRFLSVQMTGDDGSTVPVRFFDDVKRAKLKNLPSTACPLPSGGGYVVPERPLRDGVTYTTVVRLVGANVPLSQASRYAFELKAASADHARPRVRVFTAWAKRRSARVWRYRFVASVRDGSPTSCTAAIARRRVRCFVRRNRIVLAGAMRGRPRRVSFGVVVRDAAGNNRRVRLVRAVR